MSQYHIGQFVLRYQGRPYTLKKQQTLIGSDPGCDIQITDNSSIFPRHAQITVHGDKAFLQFMNRSAAIHINGIPVAEQQLNAGDVIALGDGKTVLELTNSTATPDIPTLRPTDQFGFQNNSGGKNITGQQTVPPAKPFQPIARPASDHMPVTPQPSGTTGGIPQQSKWPAPQPSGNTGGIPQQGSRSAPQPSGTTGRIYQQSNRPAPQPARQKSNLTTEATRYLCAAGHLDEEFQEYMLREVIHEKHRALG